MRRNAQATKSVSSRRTPGSITTGSRLRQVRSLDLARPHPPRRMGPGSAPRRALRVTACPGRQRRKTAASVALNGLHEAARSCNNHRVIPANAGIHNHRTSFEAGSSLDLAKPLPPRRMGPGVRRDDDGARPDSHLKQLKGRATVASRRVAPECCIDMSLRSKQRAQGRPGAGHTHGPRARKMHGAGTTGTTGAFRPSLRDGFHGVLRALPGDRALLPPSPARAVKQQRGLDLSVERPGPHDFSVRKDAGRLPTSSQPPHPCPDVRDDAYAPLR